MHTALVLTVGSRGDNEPLLALCTSLLSTTSISKIHLLIQPDYIHLIPTSPHISIHPLPFSLSTLASIYPPLYLRAILRSLLTRTPFDIVSFQRRCISLMVSRFIIPALPALFPIVRDVRPDLIISSSLAGAPAATLAEFASAPLAILNFQPNVPTAAYPNYISSVPNAQLAATEVAHLLNHPHSKQKDSHVYSATYDTGLHEASLSVLNRFRKEAALQQWTLNDLADVFAGRRPGVHVVNSYPAHLVPPGQDWLQQVHQVPPLADDYIPPDWSPEDKCPLVNAFVQAGEKPVVVSFGSMNVGGKEAQVTRAVLKGLKDAGVRRVLFLKGEADLGPHRLLGGDAQPASFPWRLLSFMSGAVTTALRYAGLDRLLGVAEHERLVSGDAALREWAAGRVHVCGEAPQYAWLLPLCAGVVCHGGAGTLFAALRAGLPVVVSPILCDQFFWGKLVEELELGAVAGPMLLEAGTGAFEKAVSMALGQKCREKVRVFGERGRAQGSGSEVAAGLLASLVKE